MPEDEAKTGEDEEKKYLKDFGRILKIGSISENVGRIEVKTIGFIGEEPFIYGPPTSLGIYKMKKDGHHTTGTRLAYFKKNGEDWKLVVSCEEYEGLTKKELGYFKKGIKEAYKVLKNPENFVTLQEYNRLSY